jgi:hypothetical protein
MTQGRRPRSEQDITMQAPARAAPETQAIPDGVETSVAPAAIERALAIYQQLQPRDQSVIVQARKILTQHIYGMVDRGERDEQRLTVGGLAHLKAIERDHDIKSAHGARLRRRPDRRGPVQTTINSMTEPVPILTVGDLKSELSRWSDETPVTFRSPSKERDQ